MLKNPIRLDRWTRWLLGPVVALGALGAPALGPQAALAAPPIVLLVDLMGDSGSTACTDLPNDCTLRGAINIVNAGTTQFAEIDFAPSVTLIALSSPLPAIVMTGTTIVGNAGLPRLDAIAMGSGDVMTLNGDYVSVSGLSIVNGPNGLYSDIHITGGTAISVYGNYLGTLPPQPGVVNCTPTGSSPVTRNSSYGITVDSLTGSSGLGAGSVYIQNNIIGCHDAHGLVLSGTDYAYVGEDPLGRPAGNFIGVNASGVPLPNGAGAIGDGINVVANGGNGARFNRLRYNTIAGNGRMGIFLSGTGTNNTFSTASNVIAGNRIGLTGAGPLGNGLDGIQMANGAFLNQVGGTADIERNVIANNGGDGIQLSDSNGNFILGNYIGTGLDGLDSQGNAGRGVFISNSNATFIGGYFLILAAGLRENVISGNQGDGIQVIGNSTSTLVMGNKIGTNAAGTAPLGNLAGGINLQVISSAVISGNVVSGNVQAGITLSDSHNLTITANLIGTNAAGTAAVGNGLDGIALGGDSTGNRVGGSVLSDRNVISGNGWCGVSFVGSSTNQVRFNLVGLNAAGTAAVPNGQSGLCLFAGSNNNVIGSASLTETQYISGNLWEGVRIVGSTGNGVYQSNRIGVAADNVTPLGNQREGVRLETVSGTAVYADLIAHNRRAGIALANNGSSGNDLGPRTVRDNDGLPIDLGDDGPTPNDPGDADSGPNTLLNYPVITLASGNVITGTACPGCSVYIYRALGDPAAPGGGGVYQSQAFADGSGAWSATLAPGLTRLDITVQAGDGSQNTSEFSPRPYVLLPLVTK